MRSIPGSRMILLDQASGVGSNVNTFCKFRFSCILWSGTSHVVVILVTRAVSCVVLFSSCCVSFVAVYLFYVYICSLLLVMVYLCSVYFVLSCCGCC